MTHFDRNYSMPGTVPAKVWPERKLDRPATLHKTVAGRTIPKLLKQLLSFPTPHGEEERLDPLFNDIPNAKKDTLGNILVRIGKAKKHNTMFSSHLDTVHKNEKKIVPMIDDAGMVYGVKEDGSPSILGADDKVGVYIMLRMIEAKVPGLYIFHVGEECGGIGSAALAGERPELFKHIDRCIAFDRMDYDSVITRQAGGTCCSSTFAEALCDALNESPALNFTKDGTGVFTDSANYTDVIGECTNLSVGYFNQHGKEEHFDVVWLEKDFLPRVLDIKWSDLPTERVEGEVEPYVAPPTRTYNYNTGTPHYPTHQNAYANSWYGYSEHTALTTIPRLVFKDPLPEGATKGAVKIAIMKRFYDGGLDYVTGDIFDLMEERDALAVELDFSERALKEAKEELEVMKGWYGGYGGIV